MGDRKYKHKGYQDGGGYGSHSGGNNKPQGPPPEPQRQRIEGAPRGRTTGGFVAEAFKCNRCGQVRQDLGELTSDETCLKCGADLHTCGNCRFFDTTTLWECRAEITARVANKQSRNECTLFAPKIIKDLSADKGKVLSPDDARKAFEALFKK